MIVTSFSPSRIDAQKRAVETWRKLGVSISAVQCNGEDFAKQFEPDSIRYVEPNRYWSKPTPSITDVLTVADEFLYVNSDIELDSIDWFCPEDKSLKVGIRTDYAKFDSQLNKYGIDVFLFTSEMQEHLRNNLWALGIPGWDYWVVLALHGAGYTVKTFQESIRHEWHPKQWNSDDSDRCYTLLGWQFGLNRKQLTDKVVKLTDRELIRPRNLC